MKKIIRTISLASVIAFTLVGFSFFHSPAILAAPASGIGVITPDAGLQETYGDVDDSSKGPTKLINNTLNFLTGVAAVWLLITIVLSGMKIIQSAKSPEEFYTHMKKIMWAAVGMVIVALAYVIVTWILTTLFGRTDMLDDPVNVIKHNTTPNSWEPPPLPDPLPPQQPA